MDFVTIMKKYRKSDPKGETMEGEKHQATPDTLQKWPGGEGGFCWEGVGFTNGPPKLPKWCPKVPNVTPKAAKGMQVLQQNVSKVMKTHTKLIQIVNFPTGKPLDLLPRIC